jgi:aspartyl-tRNA synthetase
VRIHQRALLERSFALQGHTFASMREKFGGMLEAFEYGAPPHGGIAIGIDRWAALLADQLTIREVMAFPKTSSGTDLMLDAPSVPDLGQYAELGLRYVGVPAKD